MFQTKVIKQIKTHILCSVNFYQKSCHLYENVRNAIQPDRPRQYNMAEAHSIVDKQGKNTNTHNIEYLLLFHGNSGCVNVIHNCPSCFNKNLLETLAVSYYSLLTIPFSDQNTEKNVPTTGSKENSYIIIRHSYFSLIFIR
jgi:hypothetical protein